jgi:hypothetical protein
VHQVPHPAHQQFGPPPSAMPCPWRTPQAHPPRRQRRPTRPAPPAHQPAATFRPPPPPTQSPPGTHVSSAEIKGLQTLLEQLVRNTTPPPPPPPHIDCPNSRVPMPTTQTGSKLTPPELHAGRTTPPPENLLHRKVVRGKPQEVRKTVPEEGIPGNILQREIDTILHPPSGICDPSIRGVDGLAN